MAMLKHVASKNADFGEAQWYLIFQHNEYTGKPFLDENVKTQLREEFYLGGIECAPFRFDMECKELNADFHKTESMTKSNPIIILSASIRKIIRKEALPGKWRNGLGWNTA